MYCSTTFLIVYHKSSVLSYSADYELGKTRIPVDSLIKLAEFYDVDMNYITGINKTANKFPRK